MLANWNTNRRREARGEERVWNTLGILVQTPRHWRIDKTNR